MNKLLLATILSFYTLAYLELPESKTATVSDDIIIDDSFRCIKKLNLRYLNVRNESVFSISNCEESIIKNDVATFIEREHEATGPFSSYAVVNAKLSNFNDLLKTDHQEYGGESEFSDEEILTLLKFYTGQLDIEPNNEKKELGNIEFPVNTFNRKIGLIYMYSEDMSKLILITKALEETSTL